MPSIQLEAFEPGPVSLAAPDPGETRVIYRVSGMDEAAIHGFIRMVPLLGQAMARSRLPLDQVERAGRVAGALVQALQDGRITPGELAALILAASL